MSWLAVPPAPAFPFERIVADDADFLVLDKPAGTPTHAPEAVAADALSRVRNQLARRDGLAPESVYLAVHQRLERDVSGVLVFSRRRSANAALAAQFERRTVALTFVAAVQPWTEPARMGTFQGTVERIAGGLWRAAPVHTRGAQRVQCRWRLVDREGDRALVELEPAGVPLGAVRAMLAGVRSPIVGDGPHGGPDAFRCLLHLRDLSLIHPTHARTVRFTAPVPSEFQRWLRNDSNIDSIHERLRASLDRRHVLHGDPSTTAYRLAHDAADELPGVTVDRYGEWAVVQFYDAADPAVKEAMFDAVQASGAKGIYAKFRPVEAHSLGDTRRDELAPSQPVRGEPAPDPLEICERGLRYHVRIGDGLATGIFLDQRMNREQLRKECDQASVLNLFGYTGAFTVAAAAGGARTTVTVDASAPALERARANLALNGFGGDAHAFVQADAFAWLEAARTRGDRFDRIVLDPPSFSTMRDGSRFSAKDDYARLAALALGVLGEGGVMLACTNHRGLSRAWFRKQLASAANDAGCPVSSMRDHDGGLDFPETTGGEGYLKGVWIRKRG